MKHTSFIPMDACSQDGRNPNVLKSPPDGGSWLQALTKTPALKFALLFFVFMGCFDMTGVNAQNATGPFFFGSPLTGSGASRGNDFGPEIYDPCSCTDDVGAPGTYSGITVFDDEIVVLSNVADDNWVYTNPIPSNPTLVPFLPDGTLTNPVLPGTPIPYTGQTTIDPVTGNVLHVYKLDIQHPSGVGYTAVAMEMSTPPRYTASTTPLGIRNLNKLNIGAKCQDITKDDLPGFATYAISGGTGNNTTTLPTNVDVGLLAPGDCIDVDASEELTLTVNFPAAATAPTVVSELQARTSCVPVLTPAIYGPVAGNPTTFVTTSYNWVLTTNMTPYPAGNGCDGTQYTETGGISPTPYPVTFDDGDATPDELLYWAVSSLNPLTLSPTNVGGTYTIEVDGVVVETGTSTPGPHTISQKIEDYAICPGADGKSTIKYTYSTPNQAQAVISYYDDTNGQFVIADELAALNGAVACQTIECEFNIAVDYCPDTDPAAGNQDVPGVVNDLGGSQGTNYPKDENHRVTICPNDPDVANVNGNKSITRLVFQNYYNIAAGDTVRIYDGSFGCGTTPAVIWESAAGGSGTSDAPGINFNQGASWIDATCNNASGCLTFEFAPNGDQVSGLGYEFTWEKRARAAMVECPADRFEPGICNGAAVGALHTIQMPTADCSHTLVPMNAFNELGVTGGTQYVRIIDKGSDLNSTSDDAPIAMLMDLASAMALFTDTDGDGCIELSVTEAIGFDFNGDGNSSTVVDLVSLADFNFVDTNGNGCIETNEINAFAQIEGKFTNGTNGTASLLEFGEQVYLPEGSYAVEIVYMDPSPTAAELAAEDNGSLDNGTANDGITLDTCMYMVTVGAGLNPACNDNINISLSASCSAVITPDMILEGVYDSPTCYSDFEVALLDGANTGTNVVDESYIGQTVRVQVTTNMSNSCWGNITVEDKLAPTLSCPDQVVYCGATTDPSIIGGTPTAADACAADISYIFSDAESNFGCRPAVSLLAPDTIGLVVRTWTGTDVSGNSSMCVQNVHILKPQIRPSDIIWPADTSFYCGTNPNFEPSSAGFPLVKIGNDTIALDQTCFFGLSHQDQVFQTDCDGTQKVLRHWSIIDWCRAGIVFQNPSPQFIKVIDNVGPTFTDNIFLNDITITNAGHSCDATIEIPARQITDECSSAANISIRIVGPSNTIFTNGGTMSGISSGTHNIVYIAEDDCGNTTTDTVQITVNDAVSPTVICEQNLVVSLTQDGTAWAYAATFDDGSHDNCAIDSMRVRRMEVCNGSAFPNATEWSTTVPFECCDMGSSVLVSLGVWDKAGNFNNCMVNVNVVDKVQPTLTCPPNQTVDCSANLDDLSVFGNATISGGNCNVQTLDSPVVVRNLNNCGAGTISRTWTLGSASCTQVITVQLSTTDAIQITNLPAPEVTVDCNDVDLSDYDSGDDLTFDNVGCQVIAVNYSTTEFLGETGSCRKIVRTWEIIDWCINPTASADIDNDGTAGPGYTTVTQVVRVMDSQGPVIYANGAAVSDLSYTFPVNSLTCTYDNLVLPNFTAIDNCSNATIGVTISGTIGGTTLTNSPLNTVISGITVGSHTLFLAAEDGCGNRTVQPIIINITDGVGPAMFCTDKLAINLGASSNVANLGGAIGVWASDFACKIEDCDSQILGDVLMAYPAAPAGTHGATPPAHAGTSVVFTCGDQGTQDVDIWASDGTGNWSIVRVEVTVQDNSNLCSGGGTTGGTTTGGGTTGGTTTGGGTTGGTTGSTTGGNPSTPCTGGVSFTAQSGNGQIDITVNSGPQPYTVSWDGPVSSYYRIPNGNSYTIPSLPAGTYFITVTDANGCFSSQTITVTTSTGGGTTGGTTGGTSGGGNPTTCNTTFTVAPGTGQIMVVINSGSIPYTISWDGPVSSYYRLNNGGSYTIPSLPAGVYVITVTDASGCYSTQMVHVTDSGMTGGGGNGGQGSCPVSFVTDAGSNVIWVDVLSGPQPYTIGWDGPVSGVYRPSGSGYNITNLPAGAYTVIVTDANGCFSSEMLMISGGSTTAGPCSVASTVTGGQTAFSVGINGTNDPYTISWEGEGVTDFVRVNSTSHTVTGLTPGSYTVVVTDRNGCYTFHYNVTVTPDPCANAGGDADNDGVCANDDCNDNDASIGAQQAPGTACDDGNAATTNDVIGADGCTCAGTGGNTGGGTDTGGGDGDGEGDMAAISGLITTEDGTTVENVTVNLGGYTMNPFVTGANGSFQFNSVPMYSNYTVNPQKDMNPLNGVSTFDLVLMSKHILGIDPLDSPYKHIAADVNRSGSITAYDMVQLRQLILNINSDFPNNDSWRFVDAGYQFGSTTPENESFTEIAAINNLLADTDAHFIGVKIGDVSGNASPNSLVASEVRSMTEAITFAVEDRTFDAGDLVEVTFNLENLEQVAGYQFTLDVNPAMAKVVQIKEGLAKEDNFGWMSVDNGLVTTSWNQQVDNAKGSMFTLILKAKAAGQLSDILQLNSELTTKEAYSTANELLDVELAFQTTTTNFKLYQNTPNPFFDYTTIGFDLVTAGAIELSIFDVSGQLVKVVTGDFDKGYNEVEISKSDLSGQGIYFYNIETENHVAKKRMILID